MNRMTHNQIKASITGCTPLIEERNYTERETAEILGITDKALQRWRFLRQTDLPWCKVGRSVRYFGPDIMAFINASRIADPAE